MTKHPATIGAPVKEWIAPDAMRAELEDLHAMAKEAGYPGPLRDTLAHLLAQAARYKTPL